MQELLRKMQGYGGQSITPYAPHGYYPQKDEIQSQRTLSHQHAIEHGPLKRDVVVDISLNYAFGRPIEVSIDMEDNFPSGYKLEHMHHHSSVSVFD